jgi:phenylacetate-CoA ligase
MSLVQDLRRVLEAMPPPWRAHIGSVLSWVPRETLYGAAFRRTRAEIAATERLPAPEMRDYQDHRLRNLVDYAYTRVPYYRRVMDERGVRPEHIRGAADLRLLPMLTKRELRENAVELRAKARGVRVDEVSTGGTSGEPLRFRIERGRSSVEWAFMTWQWQSAGYRLGDRRAVLRGNVLRGVSNARVHELHPMLDEIVFSGFHLQRRTLPLYLEGMRRFHAGFLHAYPSSAEMLARLFEDVPLEKRPRFRALLLGSENLYPAQRTYLERTFSCRVFAWYGHSEKALLGGGCEVSDDYHLFPQYGALEVVNERGESLPPGARGTIVGTGFLNRAMPFIRYATDDRATLVEGDCRCGRAYPRLADIEGRWEGDLLYGTGGATFSMTALNTHSGVFARVTRFRLRQERIGEVTVLVVPREGFSDLDAARIAEDYGQRTGGQIRFRIQVVEDLGLTGRGKFKFVEQLVVAAERPAAPGVTDPPTRAAVRES